MNRFVVFGTGKDYVTIVWNDIKNDEDVVFFDAPFMHKTKILDFFCKAHSAFIINKYIQLPMKRVWSFLYPMENIEITPDDTYYFYFYDNSICRYDPKYLHDFRIKHKNVYYILNMGNAMHKRKALLHPYINDIDIVYSSNKEDVERYHFKNFSGYTNNYRSAISKPFDKCTFDVFYAGNAYDRLDKIHAVYDRLIDLGLKVDIHINGVKSSSHKKAGIKYNQEMQYDEIIQRDCDAKCILEVVGDKPTMLTLRNREAIFLHRKLLTNNSEVLKASYYNPKNICYFATPDEINKDFFEGNEPIEYDYSEGITARDMLNMAVKDIESGYRWRKRKKRK